PFTIGLILSTIYLRQHYVIDLIAGWGLAHLAVWLGPKFENFWTKQQLKYASIKFAQRPVGVELASTLNKTGEDKLRPYA
ncbi:MAG: hypothetical protein ACRENF_02520, partial [Thermodesulfobacteriota bacterium]